MMIPWWWNHDPPAHVEWEAGRRLKADLLAKGLVEGTSKYLEVYYRKRKKYARNVEIELEKNACRNLLILREYRRVTGSKARPSPNRKKKSR